MMTSHENQEQLVTDERARNGLTEVENLIISDIIVCLISFLQVDVILGEPFFTSGLFPWHNLYFWYAAVSAAKMNRPGVKIVPQGATLKAMAGQALK